MEDILPILLGVLDSSDPFVCLDGRSHFIDFFVVIESGFGLVEVELGDGGETEEDLHPVFGRGFFVGIAKDGDGLRELTLVGEEVGLLDDLFNGDTGLRWIAGSGCSRARVSECSRRGRRLA